MPYYLNNNLRGISTANSNFDGTSITLKWTKAYPLIVSNSIGYNIYMNSDPPPDFTRDHFNQNPSFISASNQLSAVIEDLTPGVMYHFGVRAFEYDGYSFDFSILPVVYNNLSVLPRSLLGDDISSADLLIPLIDSDDFPSSGVVKIGTELISYSDIDGYGNLVVDERGVGTTIPNEHLTNGYDGYSYWDPNVIFWPTVEEDDNTRVYECEARFDWNKQKYLPTDGYHQKTADLLNTDMTVSDALNTGFPPFDFNPFHTNPALVFSGKCIGSYIGGMRGCFDGYSGSFMIRGVSPVTQNIQRQEVLLNVDGEPMILLKKIWTGITCTCYIQSQEYPEARCGKCLGSGIIIGWQQYHNPRRSDGKIMVRFDPAVETIEPTESGLESKLSPNAWTITTPSINNRDVLIRFDQNGNEEFRYEVINVTRNKFILNFQGLQKFTVARIRKTDVIYVVPVNSNVNTNIDGSTGVNIFRTLYTTVDSSVGFPPHIHKIDVPDSVIDISQVKGISNVTLGHSHLISSGGILLDGSEVPGEQGLGHTHTLIFLPP